MKKRLIKVLIIGFISVLILKFLSKPFANSDSILGRISNLLNSNNLIELNSVGLDKKNIDLIWYPELTDSVLIIKNGKQVGEIGYNYGPNRFKIFLSNDLEFKVGHFKTNNWHPHQYKIDVSKDSSGYRIGFTANGNDYERLEKSFNNDGLLEGQMISFLENGNCSFQGDYKNGLKHGLKQGLFKYYHKNGKIRATTQYLKDTLHGIVTKFDENGNQIRMEKYIKGKRKK